jgi:hypothetical protein
LKALELKPLVEKQQLIREYLEKAGARGGLTEAEISALGIVYAAYVVFPESPDGSLQRTWLVENWNKWVWPAGDVNDAFVRRPLDASEL